LNIFGFEYEDEYDDEHDDEHDLNTLSGDYIGIVSYERRPPAKGQPV